MKRRMSSFFPHWLEQSPFVPFQPLAHDVDHTIPLVAQVIRTAFYSIAIHALILSELCSASNLNRWKKCACVCMLKAISHRFYWMHFDRIGTLDYIFVFSFGRNRKLPRRLFDGNYPCTRWCNRKSRGTQPPFRRRQSVLWAWLDHTEHTLTPYQFPFAQYAKVSACIHDANSIIGSHCLCCSNISMRRSTALIWNSSEIPTYYTSNSPRHNPAIWCIASAEPYATMKNIFCMQRLPIINAQCVCGCECAFCVGRPWCK